MNSSSENIRIAIFAIVLFSVLSSAMAPVTKVGLAEISPFTFAFIRFFFASLLVLPFLIKSGFFSRRDLSKLVLYSLFASANIVFFVLGISKTTANASQIIYAGVPLLIIVLLKFFWGKSIKRNEITGIIIGFIGVSMVVIAPLFEKNVALAGDLYGNILLVTAIFFISFYMITSKSLQQDYSPFFIISTFILVTTVVLFPFFIWEFIQGSLKTLHFNSQGILSLAYVIIAGTIGTYLLNQYSIKHGGAVFASLTFYLSPIFGFVIAYILIGEVITNELILGGVLTIFGIYLATRT